MKVSRTLFVALLMAAMPGAATGAPSTFSAEAKPVPAPITPVSSADRLFLEQAYLDGWFGERLAELAAVQSGDVQVRAYATALEEDQSRLRSAVRGWALIHGVRPPASLDPERTRQLEQLAKLAGRDFDVTFANAVARLHLLCVARFQSESREGDDPGVVAAASSALPQLMMMRRQSETMRERLTPVGL